MAHVCKEQKKVGKLLVEKFAGRRSWSFLPVTSVQFRTQSQWIVFAKILDNLVNIKKQTLKRYNSAAAIWFSRVFCSLSFISGF